MFLIVLVLTEETGGKEQHPHQTVVQRGFHNTFSKKFREEKTCKTLRIKTSISKHFLTSTFAEGHCI